MPDRKSAAQHTTDQGSRSRSSTKNEYSRRDRTNASPHRRNSNASPTRRRSRSPRQSTSVRESKRDSTRNKDHQFGSQHANHEDTSNTKPVSAPKDAPNFSVSGALVADVNSYKGVVLKYSEPPEARKPTEKYRLYVFKGKEQVDMLHIYQQSAFLLGRERLVADIPIDHPSCSKQHAVLQFRQIVSTDEIGQITKSTVLYIIDLNSANGTFVGGNKIPPSRYYELKPLDVIKFGFSTREYVLMTEDMAK